MMLQMPVLLGRGISITRSVSLNVIGGDNSSIILLFNAITFTNDVNVGRVIIVSSTSSVLQAHLSRVSVRPDFSEVLVFWVATLQQEEETRQVLEMRKKEIR